MKISKITFFVGILGACQYYKRYYKGIATTIHYA
jgi:hypothetical protein